MPKRVDANQKAIVQALRKAGATVQSLASIGKGCPDLLVGVHGENFLLEVKSGKPWRLTPQEQAWHEAWEGTAFIALTPTDALRLFGLLKEALR